MSKIIKFNLFFAVFLSIFLENCQSLQKLNKIIWVYRESLIQNSPLTVQLCFENIKSAGENEGWQVILLNNNNYSSYVPNISHFTWIQNQSQLYPKTSRFERLLALTILKYHGGLWIDINNIMIHGLKWMQSFSSLHYLVTNLDKGNNQSEPDLILPYSSYYQSHSQKRDPDESIVNYLPGYKYGFIYARKDTEIINLWLKNYQKHYITSATIKRMKYMKESLLLNHLNNEVFQVEKALCEIIQQKQIQLDKSIDLFDKRKNANNEFQIVGFHAQYGPMALDLNLFEDLSLAMTHSLKEIQKQYLFTPNFFVTLKTQHQNFFQKKLLSLIQVTKEHSQVYSNFSAFSQTEYAVQYCQNLTFIVEGSIIAELIKNNSIAAKNNLHTISIKQRDQWQSYCNQKITNFNIKQSHQYELSSTDEDTNIGRRFFYNILNWAVYLHLISGTSRSVIRDYFQAVNWKSSYSDVREVYYWKIANQHKILSQQNYFDSLKKVAQEEFNQSNSQKQKYSWLGLKILYFKLKILSSRVTLARCYQTLCTMITYSWKLISIAFLATAIIRLICILTRHHKKIIQWLVKLGWGLLRQGEVDIDIRWEMLQVYKNLFKGRVNKRWRVMGRAMRFLKGLIVGITLGVMMVLFYCWTIVAYQEICFNGNTHFQQPWLISIIIIKIILSKILLSSNYPELWQILGLSNKSLFKFMLPIYYFCLGSCLIEFAWLREDQIFAPAILLCGFVPIAIKEVQSMANKLIAGSNGTFNRKKTNILLKMINKMLKLCSKLTNYPEKAVLIFLFTSIFLPNLRYFYLSCDNNDLVLRKLFEFLLHSSKFIIFLIFFLYVHDILQMFRQIFHQWMNNKIMGKQKKGNENTAEMIMLERVLNEMYREEQSKKEEILYEELEKVWVDLYRIKSSNVEVKSNRNNNANAAMPNRNQTTSSRIIICPMFFQHLIMFFQTILRHSFNFYMFYLLLVDPLPGLIQTQYMNIERVKMIALALIVGINFQVQHFVEKMLENPSKKPQKPNNGSVNVSNANTALTQERGDQALNNRVKLNHFKHHSIIINCICLIIFEWQRVNVVSSMVKYCESISHNMFEEQLQFEGGVSYLLESSMIYTLLGLMVMRGYVKYYLRGEQVNFLRRAYKYLVRQQRPETTVHNTFWTYLSYYVQKVLCVIKKHTTEHLNQARSPRTVIITVPQMEEQQLASDIIQQ